MERVSAHKDISICLDIVFNVLTVLNGTVHNAYKKYCLMCVQVNQEQFGMALYACVVNQG
jgi:hypothetical protein